MSTRKPHNYRARLERYYRAELRRHHVAVIDSDAASLQMMINWKNISRITSNSNTALAGALCDIPHRWTIYIALLSISQAGERYMKSTEVAPQGVYLSEHLHDVVENYAGELRDRCNPQHQNALAWLTIPDEVTLEERHAGKLFEVFGAWPPVAA